MCVRGRGLEVRVVDRRTYSMDSVNWADVVFTAGGDGTFLFGASKILHPNKPVIGLNTDPLSQSSLWTDLPPLLKPLQLLDDFGVKVKPQADD
ncbi:unnamed protein product [Trichobilharzia regenti]|nr:unnamed protein product [Trichobilharzia regenti]